MAGEQSGKYHKKGNKWRWFVGIVVVLVLSISGFAYSMYHSFTANIKETYVAIDRAKSEQRTEQVDFDRKDPFSILLLGVDNREDDSVGRSDTIIVLTVNPNTRDTKMLSIPRDTYTAIVGNNTNDKLNHAYAFGGITMSMDSVEDLLNIPIDYVVEINMDGFANMIDAVDGITVENTRAFEQNGYNFSVGTITLEGKGALAYVRNRHNDPEGDFGRQNRQRQLISGILKKAVSVNSLLNYEDIFNSLGENVQTNLTFSEMIDLQKNYKDSITNIDQLHFDKGAGEIIDAVWYYKMDEVELKKVSSSLRDHLELS
ncbi:LCP family protein [Viridibacillus sp. YIM B01967]|uniref:LCP family protein n=1 Tax=Viridibacillus soli TaxID=2798301 RepID=A0ABS1H2Z5_9BACL|nr:LCP family protein [Viridibacillus soli]MBK3493775.1 LCP family protein [Viridibacillus soli]